MAEDPINDNIKQALDVQADAINMSTQVKLNELRHDAINHNNKRKFKLLHRSLAGIATATVLAVGLMLVLPNQPTPQANDSFMFEDLELLANEAGTDFYQDIDFLTWLDENEWSDTEI